MSSFMQRTTDRRGRVYLYVCASCSEPVELVLVSRPPDSTECPRCRAEAVRQQ